MAVYNCYKVGLIHRDFGCNIGQTGILRINQIVVLKVRNSFLDIGHIYSPQEFIFFKSIELSLFDENDPFTNSLRWSIYPDLNHSVLLPAHAE